MNTNDEPESRAVGSALTPSQRFLASQEAIKGLEPLVRAYAALFEEFPRMTCFATGMAVMAMIAAARKRKDDAAGSEP